MNTMDEYLVVNEGCFKKIQARNFLSLSLLARESSPFEFLPRPSWNLWKIVA